MKFYQSGRSMVEMLGVLAIIGVLSVGAIAGYSKAMMKYKLNKQAEQLSWLLNVMYQYKSLWTSPPPYISLVPIYKKMNVLDENMIKDNTEYLYDVFNMQIRIRTNDCPDNKCQTTLLTYALIGNNTFDICNNIIQTAKNFHGQLQRFGVYKSLESTSSYATQYYGDKYCGQSVPCIRNMTFDNIDDQCKYCNEAESCFFYFTYYIND